METLINYFLNDPTFNHIVQALSLVIVASKVVPALRVFGLFAQAILLILNATRWWLKTNPHGQVIADQTNIDEKITELVLKHDSEVSGSG